MTEQNNSTSKSANQIPITAYLSYRQRNPHNATALELLEKHCSDQAIQLIYDKEAIHPGESIKKFMDELASARCIFIFLTPDYFESSYTLYELVTIAQWADLDQRLIFPIRVTNDLTDYQTTAPREYWDKTERIRDKLACLLNTTDHENAWKQVETAWNKIVSPYLEKLNVSLDSVDRESQSKIVEKLVEAAKSEFMAAILEETKKLQSKIKFEITSILKKNLIPLDQLAKEIMPVTATSEAIAEKLITQISDKNAIAIITKAITEKKKSKAFNQQQWEECHYHATQIGGWLLINSVDPFWWFNHQLKMKQLAAKSVTRTYTLTHQPYLEVIVSRSMTRDARFQLDKEGKAQPANNGFEVPFFDGISTDAIVTQLLYPIYQDLHQSPNESLARPPSFRKHNQN
ncbi:toll/interleukin-1 receptor domain-containing protein [Nitrosomonas sp.]|uniref:toll/interleukin-1 receptor domain-containing protein n=1 Tax=Nitrosomonas sp. TaxID=42353 RepID=UPI0025F8308A|nr:toll/interleukin-1 receptor domain-containing protein [Nitrosomonas sp.]